MTLKDRLLTVVQVFAETRGLSISRVSTLVFGDGKVIDRLRNNSDVTTGRYEAAMVWLAANWPETAVWPDDVPRPETAPSVQTGEAALLPAVEAA